MKVYLHQIGIASAWHSFRYTLIMAMAILTVTPASGALERKVKNIDVVIEMPKAGDINNDYKPKVISAKSEWGDLAASGDIIVNIRWTGKFDKKEKNTERFQAGYTYLGTMNLTFANPPGKTQYYANYITANGGWLVRNFAVTINGQSTDLEQYTAIRSPNVSFSYTVPGEIDSSVSIKAVSKFREEELHRRKMNKCYDHALADAHLLENNTHEVYVYNADGENLPYTEGGDKDLWNLTTVIFEGKGTREHIKFFAEGPIYLQNITNVWISQNSNAVDIVSALTSAMYGRHGGTSKLYRASSWGIRKSAGTVYVPEAQVAAVKALLKDVINEPVFTVKAYKGDVYEAQRNNAAHDICDKHLYTAAITAADRVITYSTCEHTSRYYYSCTYCGKIEHNPNHTFVDFKNGAVITKPSSEKYGGHQFFDNVARNDCYIGVNAAGQHTYWTSCINCHHGWGYCYSHPSDRDLLGWKAQDAAVYRKLVVTETENLAKEALASNNEIANTFTMPDRATARVSDDPALQSDVNYALCVNLADKPLLGNDYTVAATRRQLLSIAVRLTEELIGHSVPLAKTSPYADAADSCTLKAATMQLTDGFATSKLAPATKVTRQEMATVIYRALRYVEQNSDYLYSDYESHLDSYNDRSQLQTWAVEPMAFMEALGLITPTTSTTLAPNAPCTIEVALSTAYKSTFAQLIGWAQLPPIEVYTHPAKMGITPDRNYTGHTELENSRRVWITGPRIGPNELSAPVLDPYSGLILFGAAEYFYHVRSHGGDPAKTNNRIKAPANTTKATTTHTKTRRTVTKKKTVSRTQR